MTIWSILRPLEIFYGHLVYFVVTCYIFPRFGILDQEKSGNPFKDQKRPKNDFIFVPKQIHTSVAGETSPFRRLEKNAASFIKRSSFRGKGGGAGETQVRSPETMSDEDSTLL
jgi:hypothetical protein